MSRRLFSPEKRLAFENLLTPVRKQNRTWASQSLIVAYSPRKSSLLLRAISGSSRASRIGLSHSSISTTTRWPVWARRVRMRWSKHSGPALVAQPHSGASANAVQLRSQVDMQEARAPDVPLAEAEAHDGMADGPVPALVGAQSLEECPTALEQLLQRVQEEALAEASRPRQKVMGPLLDKPHGKSGLVDITAVVLAELGGTPGALWANGA